MWWNLAIHLQAFSLHPRPIVHTVRVDGDKCQGKSLIRELHSNSLPTYTPYFPLGRIVNVSSVCGFCSSIPAGIFKFDWVKRRKNGCGPGWLEAQNSCKQLKESLKKTSITYMTNYHIDFIPL
jgi:hypothetical protein